MEAKNYKGIRPITSLLERFKTIKNVPPNTLFDIEPEWSKLKENKCPICGNKLLFPRGRSIAICKGKSHGDKKPFVIKNQTLEKLSTGK